MATMQTKAEMYPMSGYPTMGSMTSAYTPTQSSSQLYPPQQPYTPRTPPPAGFLQATYPDTTRFPQQQRMYPTTSSGVMVQSPGVKYKPLAPHASGSKTTCMIVYGLLAFGILLGFIMAIAFGVSWKSGQWGYP